MSKHHNSLVVKSNVLVEAMSDLGLQELRFLAFAASQLPHDLKPEQGKPYDMEIDVQALAETFQMEPKSAYREVKGLANRLMRKIIDFNTEDGLEVSVGLITKRKYHEGEGRLWFRFDEDLLPHLMGLTARFTQYRLKDVYQFTRPSIWRIYELLKEFKTIGQRDIDLEDIRWKLGLESKYERPIDLKKYVIDPAIEEINATSDIQVQYEQKKRGRRITGFTFIIRDNPNTRTPQEKARKAAESLDNGQDLAPALAKTLTEEYRVSQKQARQLANLAVGQEERVLAKLPKIKARFERLKDKKTNLGGYIFNALKDELTQRQGGLPL